MVKFVGGLDIFLASNYPKEFPLIALGHVELFTEEMQKEYLQWYSERNAAHCGNKECQKNTGEKCAFVKMCADYVEVKENAMYCMVEDCPYQKGEPCTAAEGCGGYEGVE